MNPHDVTANPALRHRIPLYPTQFLCAMAIVSLGPLLDSMMTDLGVSLSRGGLISAGLFAGNVSGIVILNTVLARVAAKRILLSGTLLQGASLIAAGLATTGLSSLFVAYLFVGFSGALMNATCWMWQSAHMKKNAAAAALQMILFFGLAMMIVPLVLGLVLDEGATWRWILVTEGGLSLLSAVAFIGAPLLDIPGRQNVRPAQLKQVFSYNVGLLLGMMGAGFTYVGAEMTMNVWLPKFQIDVFDAGDTWASLSVTLFWAGLIAGRLIVMTLTKRFSPARLLLVCACVMAVFTVAVAFAPSQVASLVLTVGAGLGASASYGLIGSYSGRFPGWQSSVASSIFILSGGIGSITFPYIMGPLADSAGFQIALALIAVPAIVYALFALLIHARAGERGHTS
ncbi:MAG: MFS transporter [Thermoleophilia bacterium]|nr:MFS transporter [Thermoleophilia bacterium]